MLESYDYDAIYRLIEATGREHLGQNGGTLNAPQQPTDDDSFRTNLPHPSDGTAMGNYTERYKYDGVGNILKMVHAALSGSWTRTYQYDPNSNRLLLTSNPSGSLTDVYAHDAHGNMISMPHLQAMQWDFKDHLQSVDLGGGGKAYYTYDSAGQRVRKVWEKQGGLVEERIYLDGFELFRRHLNGSLELERETLHVMDDKRRVVLVETKTVDNSAAVGSPSSLFRYQFDNHLGSASLELDEQAGIISYEEYYPYGNTSYQAVAGNVDLSLKRYRYTGREKDEESGFEYHLARYYLPWLGRWTCADPIGIKDGVNLYVYVRNNPIKNTDREGTETKLEESDKENIEEHEAPGEIEVPDDPPPKKSVIAKWSVTVGTNPSTRRQVMSDLSHSTLIASSNQSFYTTNVLHALGNPFSGKTALGKFWLEHLGESDLTEGNHWLQVLRRFRKTNFQLGVTMYKEKTDYNAAGYGIEAPSNLLATGVKNFELINRARGRIRVNLGLGVGLGTIVGIPRTREAGNLYKYPIPLGTSAAGFIKLDLNLGKRLTFFVAATATHVNLKCQETGTSLGKQPGTSYDSFGIKWGAGLNINKRHKSSRQLFQKARYRKLTHRNSPFF